MARIQECILYRDFQHGELLEKMTALMNAYGNSQEDLSDKKTVFYECVNSLVEMAGDYGFSGNLWHNYLTFLLVNHENAFSTACEIRGAVKGSINEMAMNDFAVFKELYDFDLECLDRAFHTTCCRTLCSYENIDDGSKMFNKRIRDRICSMSKTLAAAKTTGEFMEDMVQFYKDFGVGKLGLHKAFRIDHDENGQTIIAPITRIAHVKLEDLVGYEIPKQKLIENTEAFVRGRKANNCLLFGDAGTGKSSSIKGILNRYYDEGLRIIEVYKHQFQDLNDVIAQIKNRNYKFIIYMDDLSFEEFETEYKYLKAVIEGGLEKKPDNILIYATSNRRHLVRERAGDKLELMDDDDLHSSDTVQEKLSLVYRFGVRIYFGAPEKREFEEIVETLAERNGIDMPRNSLLMEANKWELSHGGRTGRTAQQFIDYLLGKEGEGTWQ
ncbi:MAG: ATP-binding protein [Eubacteriales bacterium]|nr:ATP-binding protein [Eubacteriales bacterium]